jgi:hypothetical protein
MGTYMVPMIKHKPNEGNTMTYTKLKRLIANPENRRWANKTYAIWNEYGLLTIVYADHEQEALDEAMDAGRLDGQLMSPEDYEEAIREGWDDVYMLLGNASEPVWSTCLGLNEITRG